MTDIRVSQQVAEAIRSGPADIRVSQQVAEALRSGPADIRATQQVAEVLRSGPANIRVSQQVVEVLVFSTANIRVSQQVAEVLRTVGGTSNTVFFPTNPKYGLKVLDDIINKKTKRVDPEHYRSFTINT